MKYSIIGIIASLAVAANGANQSFSFYFGNQGNSPSTAYVTDIDGSTYDFPATWEGRSFDMPVYYGFRYTNWAWGNLGWAIDFTHSKAYSSDDTRADSGFDVLEFTDGINVLTADVFYRLNPLGKITPYGGIGLGTSIPHVELQSPQMDDKVFEYQFAGLAATGIVGASYQLTEHWAIFGEGKFDRSWLKADMENGKFETTLDTHAFNFGISYHW